MLKFEWNAAKSAANIRIHGVSFDEARTVFYDEFAVQFYDNESSEVGEDRFLLLWLSSEARMLLVCHCERDDGNTIRIISARKATRKERMYYEGKKS